MPNIENFPMSTTGDRFIPCRKDRQTLDFKVMKSLPLKSSKDAQILQNIFPSIENNILNFGTSKDGLGEKSKHNFTTYHNENEKRSKNANLDNSKIIEKGEKLILDAPGFKNDYYLHLLDAYNENIIGSILASTIFIMNKKDKYHTPIPLNGLLEDSYNEPTSINFNKQLGPLFCYGNSNGEVKLFDWENDSICESFKHHTARIGSIQFNPSKAHIFATGSKDTRVAINDVRDPISRLYGTGHVGEVCGLSWNSNGILLASGGNDNLINIWDIRKMKSPISQISEHKAAVRALGWCPWKSSILASGGGSGDMTLLMTNTSKNKVVKRIKTNSQICALLWDEDVKGILTAHGFSKYQLSMWKYSTEELLYEFVGHKNRILSMIRPTPDGSIITGSADESIRIWNMRNYIRPFVKSNSQISPLLLR
jgi:cell division cycle protein 20 (cofactor of APC complex)